MKGIIVKIGNSYGIRIPKRYVDDHKLKLGEEVELPKQIRRDSSRALAEFKKYADSLTSPVLNFDPVAWQRQERSNWDDDK